MIDYLENLGAILFAVSIIFVLTFFYTQRIEFKVKGLNRKTLTTAIVIKVMASIVFCYYFESIYKAGDTLQYHIEGSIIAERLLLNPIGTFKSIYLDQSNVWYVESYFESGQFEYIGKPLFETVNIIKLTALFELISLRNFYACSILMSFFAFTGVWKIYELICLYFPHYKRSLSLIIFLPTIIFWTGGILKDTITLGVIGWVVFSIFILFRRKQYWPISLIIVFLGMVLISLLKPYVLVVLIPTVIFGILFELINQIKSRLTAILWAPMLGFFLVIIGAFIMYSIQNNLGGYGDFENLIERSEIVKKGFDQTIQSGAVSINKTDPNSIIGIISIIGSVLFRPFIWESWSTITLFSSVENLGVLLITIFSILAILFFPRVLKTVYKNPFLIFCIMFSLTFTIALGISVSNFGALMRFKSAYLIFYLIPLIIIIQESKIEYKKQSIKKGED